MKIPFLSFEYMHNAIKSEMKSAFEKVYDSNWYIMGQSLTEFEKEYANFNEVKQVVGVSNGLDALFLSLKALGISSGHEVIVPSNTYIATALAVSYLGAKPVFVEPDIDTYNINPASIEQAITKNTKAIIPVHLYGQCCRMDEIMSIANEYGLYVIEDNAQSQGSSFNNKKAGSWGHLNATSFYPGKNLGALGDAGAITTNDGTLAGKVRMLRNYGSSKKYYNDEIGHNMRLDELQAAFLSVKLSHLDAWTAQRQKLAADYKQYLSGIKQLILPSVADAATSVYHLYVIRTEKRNELQTHLEKMGIGTMIHYPVPPHLQDAYKFLGYQKGDFPIAEKLADTMLSLPLWPGMRKEQLEYIAEAITVFFN
jgi:dTDP-4-amino-4,6-dideoxygalactose transaminase